ncbi:hypothetical protein B5P45_09125 [Phyllobacterium zundukense]|uniref:Uncharacterized protein n=1 Tax=Phyllobacterium zundukense TaxID=1867719 RepID=A0A2N9W0C4_9HYPH|nr:hypothetical protein BLM14_02035 [Phyllobacterium zundukense]PIO45192.1 hypothetical protein B5P45_09125 [Phyllobacterium zundukense]
MRLSNVAAGQKEAADAIGLSQIDSLRFIILPQGLMVALLSEKMMIRIEDEIGEERISRIWKR